MTSSILISLQILKRDIHVPEKRKIAVSQLLDYPPRLAIFAHNVPGQPLPELQVMGLDIEHSFAITSEEFLWHFHFKVPIISLFYL